MKDTATQTARIIDGKVIAEQVRREVINDAAAFISGSGVTPRIVFILVGNNPASEVYVASKGKSAEEAGYSHETLRFPPDISEKDLLGKIDMLNNDSKTHAILCQLPLPKHISEEAVIEAVAPEKDIDGFHPVNVGRLSIGRGEYFAPCTPLGIIEMMKRDGISASGKHVVIVGRSNIVGKPMAALLVQKNNTANAIVTIAHTGAGNSLGDYTRSGDILIAAMGVAHAITAEMVKPGAVVIDVGMNRIPDATKKSGSRLVGDVDFENAKHIASAITPVPGGVGPMTIAMVLKNTLTAAKRQTK
ncbi:MAG TPA: bifunctional 5,10-methylenetetrahydrofolate dehydrogenase/5,10-methenyltetrahydrofolate cyclohydrolase [Candidatus Kapabacteria bacterium]|nr:bifunctional 5,10-methylenetetrahydrofolate dehydrogenase/5,10-methenyltetrahydrofolate cyclohydrolase [Candidatus Kapabacteria bacterium]